ncbi:MAG TPA: hypothetical protein DHI91_01590 [Candidatus Portnoybacteria bacterium]|nr:hypothetical protein [Candidatus Portnoybacteria bacterium]
MDKSSLKEIFGYMPKAIWWNFVIGAFALLLGIAFGGPKIYIERLTAYVVFFIFLAAYAAIVWWSVLTLAKNKMRESLVTSGPYAFARHPVYSATLLILNTALAVLFRSWLLILAIIPIYFVWRKNIRLEDRYLTTKFGQAHQDYRRATLSLFPNLWRINKKAFYILVGLAVFATAFIILNFPSVYLRWVVFEKSGQITYDEPAKKKSLWPTGHKANYIEKRDSIIINKLGLDVPLVPSSGTTQTELNAALNQGVIIYPGSALPGQAGEVFLSGHSSVYPWVKTEYGQVFALLDKLETGDVVSLIYDRYQYDYQITGKQILSPKDTRITMTSQPALTLMTCWPIGTSAKRLVVHGELIK